MSLREIEWRKFFFLMAESVTKIAKRGRRRKEAEKGENSFDRRRVKFSYVYHWH